MEKIYNVYRDGELHAEGVQGNSYTDTDVNSSMSYEYQVSAVTDAGESELSEPVEVTTEPTVTTGTDTETIDTVAYSTVHRDTDEMPVGESRTVQNGVDGYTTVTYTITYHDGTEVSREETNREVTPPVDEIIENGTYEEPEPESPEDGEED